MFGTIFDAGFANSWTTALAVIFSAAAVKLMDDAVDAPADRDLNRPNWTRRLDRAVTPYALVTLALGVMADAAVAVAIFCAAYMWGMAGHWRETMPSGLPAWAEGGLAMAFCIAAYGPVRSLTALMMVIAADLWDDFRDEPSSSRRWEKGLLAVALATAVLAAAPVFGAASLLAVALITGPLAGLVPPGPTGDDTP